ncbi:MAG: hypothetical protein GC159_10385 [Phycisphaera sp.]|nr:hypothetical protein [Phycisphaera sp.]
MNPSDALIDRYLDEDLDGDSAAELERLIAADAQVASRFAKRALIHSLMIERARYGTIEAEPIPVARLAPSQDEISIQSARGGRVRSGWYGYAAAAVLLMVTGVGGWLWWPASRWTSTSTPDAAPVAHVDTPTTDAPVARLTSVTGANWESSDGGFDVGAPLDGQRLKLRGGSAEFQMQSTAIVTMLGPADVEVLGPNRCRVHSGRLMAKAPPNAHGFTVETPSAVIVDLGTEFTVQIGKAGNTRVNVVRGAVNVSLPDGSATHRAAAGESVTVGSGSRQVSSASYDVTPFVRPVPAGLFNTGVSTVERQADPHWRIVARSDAPSFKPQQAIVTGKLHMATPATDHSRWISAAVRQRVDPGVEMTFATTFDVPADQVDRRFGIRLVADNYLVAVRLNGEPVAIDDALKGLRLAPEDLTHLSPVIAVDGGLVAGRNTLEIVVRNGPDQTTPPVGVAAGAELINMFGLRAEFVPLLP